MASSRPASALTMRVVSAPPTRPVITTVNQAVEAASTATILSSIGRWQRRNRASDSWGRGLEDVAMNMAGEGKALGFLWLRAVDGQGRVDDLGLVSCRVVTDVGVRYLIDAMQGLADASAFKYHGVGTGTGAEAASNTALGSELTTQYATSNTRPTGTAGEASGSANTYETSATIAVSASVALTEHGIFSRAAVAGGVLFDRSVFPAVNLAASESLQATYQFTLPSGS